LEAALKEIKDLRVGSRAAGEGVNSFGTGGDR